MASDAGGELAADVTSRAGRRGRRLGRRHPHRRPPGERRLRLRLPLRLHRRPRPRGRQGLRRLRLHPHQRRLQDHLQAAPTAPTRRPRGWSPRPTRSASPTAGTRTAGRSGPPARRASTSSTATRTSSPCQHCGRSNATFADEEGAFVANIDGPVRAIRSYVGANSGPLTQRTHLMYRDSIDVVTDLRVHDIPAIMDFLDFSAAATGHDLPELDHAGRGHHRRRRRRRVHRRAHVGGGRRAPGPGPAPATRSSTDAAGVAAGMSWFYRDQTTPPEQQCWGDGSFLGRQRVEHRGRHPEHRSSATAVQQPAQPPLHRVRCTGRGPVDHPGRGRRLGRRPGHAAHHHHHPLPAVTGGCRAGSAGRSGLSPARRRGCRRS